MPAPALTSGADARGERARFLFCCFRIVPRLPHLAPQTASSPSPCGSLRCHGPTGLCGTRKATHRRARRTRVPATTCPWWVPCAAITQQCGAERAHEPQPPTEGLRTAHETPGPGFTHCPAFSSSSVCQMSSLATRMFFDPQNFSKAGKEFCFSHDRDDRL